jgi:DNA-binding XRE family transcriptional regulator
MKKIAHNWLWDINASVQEAKRILADENNPEFYIFAQRLFSRVVDQREAFEYLDKECFIRIWPKLKNRLLKDAWNKSKVAFWEKVYRRLAEELQGDDDILDLRRQIAEQLRLIRLSRKFTQVQMAKELGVIQQYVSRMESGRENFSLDTLARFARFMHKKLEVRLS